MIKGKFIHEYLPHVPEMWRGMCEDAINLAANQSSKATPVFTSKKHVLAEICGANALMLVEDYLSPKEREFCYAVYQYMADNSQNRENWDIGHIELEDDEPTGLPTDFSDLIDPSVQSGSGLKIGDRLAVSRQGLRAEMAVVGFDEQECPFVKYTKVEYSLGAKPDGEKEGDEFRAGDIMPFPWTDPMQYKI